MLPHCHASITKKIILTLITTPRGDLLSNFEVGTETFTASSPIAHISHIDWYSIKIQIAGIVKFKQKMVFR